MSNPKFKPGRLEARVERARSAIGKGIRYKMGQGGFFPDAPLPDQIYRVVGGWIRPRLCDCSGFVAWVLGMRRDQINAKKWWSKLLPWIETTMVYADATGPQRVFVKIAEPVPGCLVVYGDTEKSQGHIGVVTMVDPDVTTRYIGIAREAGYTKGLIAVVDCSSGMSKKTGDAIHERDGAVFLSNLRSIFCVLKEDLA